MIIFRLLGIHALCDRFGYDPVSRATCFSAGVYLTYFKFTFNKAQQAKHSQAWWEVHTSYFGF